MLFFPILRGDMLNTTETGQTTRHRDVFRAFYTSNERLVSYMVTLLEPKDGDVCLEPAAGSGCFVDGLLATNKRLNIRAIELNRSAIDELRTKYSDRSDIVLAEQDFLFSETGLFHKAEFYDRIIGNPPYGAWQELTKRASLKTRFPDLYVRETYGLFLAQALTLLKPNGRLVFIVPETFLYIHLQKNLRWRILSTYTLSSVDVFPSGIFPGVNFGYAKLCIIVIQNIKPTDIHCISIRQISTLDELFENQTRQFSVSQSSVLQRQDYALPLHGNTSEIKLIDRAQVRLGDIADCVTGFYTGEDGRFLRRAPSNPRKVEKYAVVDPCQVVTSKQFSPNLQGFSGVRCFVPVLKGGGSPYLKPELWYVDWSTSAIECYKSSTKARFQNSSFYFRNGIGFPMVTSTRATASMIRDHWIFDQSIVGIFPRESAHFYFLLAFLNSTTCWKLLRQINPSANNSAKYLQKLPIILPSQDRLSWFAEFVSDYVFALESGKCRDYELEQLLDEEIRQGYATVLSDNFESSDDQHHHTAETA